MQKSLRSIVLASLIALTAAPAHAGVMGTDPRPVGHIAAPTITQTILGFLGF